MAALFRFKWLDAQPLKAKPYDQQPVKKHLSVAVLSVLLLGLLGAGGCSTVHNTLEHSSSTHSSGTQQTASMVSFRQLFSGVGVLNGITHKDFNAHYNLAYGPDARQKLDIYQPKVIKPDAPLRPVILFVHGGAWKTGSKEDYLFVGESFTRAGYITVVMNYRLAPAHRYPDYIRDTAQAISWLTQHIAQYGGDPAQLVVMGHSAGAFNAVEAVDNPRWLSEVKVPVSNIRAVVGIAGPYSYDFRTDSTRDAFAQNAQPDEVMPDRHVRRDAPPHLLLIGSNDQRVGPANAYNMQHALQAQHVPVQLQVVNGATHVSIMAAVATRLSWYRDTRQQILDYLAKVVTHH